ncbi:hypothetical protein CPB83DRAFT_852400 [Crepidotus variabilis]|uniref:Calpain catalytic domain-containing protein n=1 Tax=Crepidotus variabilis TaxID=179855 RepID=A0A9P6EIJ5_9AGAR|nr:hypothetical protein CPB83DRAFT_852400 [Crepidotus variabilis]
MFDSWSLVTTFGRLSVNDSAHSLAQRSRSRQESYNRAGLESEFFLHLRRQREDPIIMSEAGSTIHERPRQAHGHHNGNYNYAYNTPPPPLSPSARYAPMPPPPARQNTTPPKVERSSANIISYAQQQVGAPVTEGMLKAFDECRTTVERIATHCRTKNRKFRDVEFDLENDPNRCLHNLFEPSIFAGTSDVRRVTEIFDKPEFYGGTSKSAEVVQGAVEDCYLVSALSTMTSIDYLIQNLCVARDEEVGVYGFIFYRDCYWVPVVIDDLLFTRVPKYEQLTNAEKELYHFEKEKYNDQARKGAESLYFARPANGSQETWVPLVEKAYAKLHGDYASIMFGRTCDAIEDMTGGVSNLILSRDIFDKDKFWNEELLKANDDRLFGCWFKNLTGMRSGVKNASIDGLVGNLSHSVVKAVEIKGKRFVVLRDPWGDAGWDGAWSDGSKEWTKEWMDILPELGHSFGEKGQFIMEYKDFLTTWQEIQRTLIFDDSWVMSSQWLHISQPFPCMDAFSYGDLSFTFSLSKASPAVIVLSKYNLRYFKDIQGPCIWNMDFILAKEGDTEPLAESSYSFFYTRSVSVEVDLEPGNYVVLVRLDPVPVRDKDYFRKGLDNGWDRRKLARIMTQRAQGQSIAANYKPNPQLLPTPVDTILSSEKAKADKTTIDAIKSHSREVKPGESLTVTTTTTTTTVIQKSNAATEDPLSQRARPYPYSNNANNISAYRRPNNGWNAEPGWVGGVDQPPPLSAPASPPMTPNIRSPGPLPPGPLPSGSHPPLPPPLSPRPLSPPPLAPPLMTDMLEEDNSIVVGLKIYTQQETPTVICGRLKDSRQSGRFGSVRY